MATTTTTPATTPAVETLPATIKLTYLAEGAANIIYRLSFSPGEPSYPNELLRARKALPSAQPNLLAFSHLTSTFHPLFPSHLLLPTRLIKIPPSILTRENTHLLTAEHLGTRPQKRHGLYLELTEEYGYMIMDMSPRPLPTPPASPGLLSRAFSRIHKPSPPPPQTRQLLIEFKPKWILQSPAAPASWRRCRTCALRLSKAQKKGFCPLDLASGDEARVGRAVEYILPVKQPVGLKLGRGVGWEDARRGVGERIVGFLVGGELMPELKRMHGELDPYGPVAVRTMDEGVKERFVTAMTVRDLTVFLRVDLDAEGVEARIGDLDLKTGEGGKWEYWEGVERSLMEGGWYGGTEEGAEEKGVWCTP